MQPLSPTAPWPHPPHAGPAPGPALGRSSKTPTGLAHSRPTWALLVPPPARRLGQKPGRAPCPRPVAAQAWSSRKLTMPTRPTATCPASPGVNLGFHRSLLAMLGSCLATSRLSSTHTLPRRSASMPPCAPHSRSLYCALQPSPSPYLSHLPSHHWPLGTCMSQGLRTFALCLGQIFQPPLQAGGAM